MAGEAFVRKDGADVGVEGYGLRVSGDERKEPGDFTGGEGRSLGFAAIETNTPSTAVRQVTTRTGEVGGTWVLAGKNSDFAEAATVVWISGAGRVAIVAEADEFHVTRLKGWEGEGFERDVLTGGWCSTILASSPDTISRKVLLSFETRMTNSRIPRSPWVRLRVFWSSILAILVVSKRSMVNSPFSSFGASQNDQSPGVPVSFRRPSVSADGPNSSPWTFE